MLTFWKNGSQGGKILIHESAEAGILGLISRNADALQLYNSMKTSNIIQVSSNLRILDSQGRVLTTARGTIKWGAKEIRISSLGDSGTFYHELSQFYQLKNRECGGMGVSTLIV